jgi:hypothetical protein
VALIEREELNLVLVEATAVLNSTDLNDVEEVAVAVDENDVVDDDHHHRSHA